MRLSAAEFPDALLISRASRHMALRLATRSVPKQRVGHRDAEQDGNEHPYARQPYHAEQDLGEAGRIRRGLDELDDNPGLLRQS